MVWCGVLIATSISCLFQEILYVFWINDATFYYMFTPDQPSNCTIGDEIQQNSV